MENKYHGNLEVSSAPHLVGPVNTTKIMGMVLIALIPAFAVGIYQFGYRAAVLTIVCVAACVLFEYLMNKIMKREQTVGDLSAVVTGVLLAFNLPAGLPYWIAVVGCFAAIVVVKYLFGGLGQNLVNASNLDMFLGNIGGCIGEVSACAILIGGIFLILTRVISAHIPVSFLATVFVCGLIWGGLDGAIFHLCAGGVMLGAFFCATDYVTSPMLPSGKIIFGIGCGLFTMLIRLFASYPEGVSFAILLMNVLTPYIDRITEKLRYRLPKKAKEGAGNNGKQ